jgi:hypothetical protein
MQKLSLIDEILAKTPSQWTQEEWDEVRDALIKGYLKVSSRALTMDGVPSEPARKLLEPFQDWPTSPYAPIPPLRWSPPEVFETYRQPCAIEEYFKANPDKLSVMMVCQCPKCTIHC